MNDRTTIIRVQKRENPYVMLDKEFLSNEELSWKAKGLLAYLLSKPDDWQIAEADLIRRSKDGRDAVRAGLRELEASGYLARRQVREPGGKFARTECVVYERPKFGKDGWPSNEYSSNGKSAATPLEASARQTCKANNGAENTVDGKSVHGATTDGKSDACAEEITSETPEALRRTGSHRGRENRRRKTRQLLNNELTNHVVVVEHPQSGSTPGDDLALKRRIVLSAFPEVSDPGVLDDLLAAREPGEVRQAVDAVRAYAQYNHVDNLTGALRDALERRWVTAGRSCGPVSRKKSAGQGAGTQGRDKELQKQLIKRLYV